MSPALHRRSYIQALGAGLATAAVSGVARAGSTHEPGIAWETRLDGGTVGAITSATRLDEQFVLAGTRLADPGPLTDGMRAPVVASYDGGGSENWRWSRELDARQSALDVLATSDGNLLVGGVGDEGDRKAITLDRIDAAGAHDWYAGAATDWRPFRVRVAEFVGSDRFAVGTSEWVGMDDDGGRLSVVSMDGEWQSHVEFDSSTSSVLAMASGDESVAVVGTYDAGCDPNQSDWLRVAEPDGTAPRRQCSEDFTDVMARTPDGGYVFGFADDEGPGLRLTDDWGRTEWSRTYDAPGADRSPADVVVTADGGYALLATYLRSGSDDHRGSLVVKTDAEGRQEWVRRLAPAGRGVAGHALLPAGEGRLFVGGSTSDPDRTAWAAMLDESADADLEPATSTPTVTPTDATTATPPASPTATSTDPPGTTRTSSGTGTRTETGTSPGFGLLGGIAGLAGGVAALRRRFRSE